MNTEIARTSCSITYAHAEKHVDFRAARRGLIVTVSDCVGLDRDGAPRLAGYGQLVPWSDAVDLCAALLGDDGDTYDRTTDDGLAARRVRVHRRALGVFVGVRAAYHGDADGFRARSATIPPAVAAEIARAVAEMDARREADPAQL